ncbi:proteasome maturation protein [Tribolium castaneum]|uniref:Proteasome maturation protein-like Protein n=1 Tax=Tribolium castaneum TaxID=7070 RepID=D2A1N4_TRICA|nr:PREDICTED: proteasome maturation protein [Tribolium castaneum]EFA01520.2 Proteasome maturation protein-like Protein [Tribolium castaneum]|eukprot:XP_008192815.1 PREDICTED: proteasome maturation protein [Tribolium castaneum]
MSFALPSVKSKPGQPEDFCINEGKFGVPEAFTGGLSSVRASLDVPHPLMLSELNYRKNLDKMNMTILRNTQGLHAPLRIAMEQKAVKKVGHLPFLPSHNVLHESLTGRDIEMDSTDVFNTPEFVEIAGLPHAVVEKSLGIL